MQLRTSRRDQPREAAPEVPGIIECRALLRGRHRPPWTGQEFSTGEQVVVRPVPAHARTPEGHLELERRLAALPHHEGLVVPQLREDVPACWLVSRYLPGEGLDQVVTRRGGSPSGGAGGVLTPGEAAGVAVAAARVLAALHAEGMVLGSLRASDVLLGPTGEPHLDAACLVTRLPGRGVDHGATPRPGARSSAGTSPLDRAVPGGRARATPAGDVMALSALVGSLVRAPVPAQLASVLAWAGGRASSSPVDTEPSAVELLRRLVAAQPPEPVRLSMQGLVARPTRTRRLQRVQRLARPLGTVAVAVAVLLGAVALGVRWSRPGAPSPRPAASSSAAAGAVPAGATDWVPVLASLDERRAAAFERLDASMVAAVDAPGSAALDDDMTALRALLAANVHAVGLRSVVQQVHVVQSAPEQTTLEVVDVRPAYRLVRADGSQAALRAARGSARWRVVLVRADGTWLISRVSAA